jgi:mediator of RNA polymerase II transcription subunit 21
MFASIRYIQTRHQFAAIPDQPDMSDPTAPNAPAPLQPNADPNTLTASAAEQGGPEAAALQQQQQQQQPQDPDQPPGPDDPATFEAALRELARDLVLKEQQIEYLISVLPGIGESEANQSQRIQALEKELREADDERKIALAEREDMLVKLGALAGECKRVY